MDLHYPLLSGSFTAEVYVRGVYEVYVRGCVRGGSVGLSHLYILRKKSIFLIYL